MKVTERAAGDGHYDLVIRGGCVVLALNLLWLMSR